MQQIWFCQLESYGDIPPNASGSILKSYGQTRRYIDTTFRQLEFAWKLYNYVLEGRIHLDDLDNHLTFQEWRSVFVLQDKFLNTSEDLVLACENNLTIAIGATAITLNRCSEEAGIRLSDPIVTEIDQFAVVAYQIRNAFAHDIAEPRRKITNTRYTRVYEFGGIRVDLRNVSSKHFEYSDIGAPEVLVRMKHYGQQTVWPNLQLEPISLMVILSQLLKNGSAA